ncbi:PREDICTED: carcinoembryonic antigen-related cell adhesion molecule 5-like, partial [Odobenus rosmarus divergens]|uniref:Carcinoembryonic antigen-related cell adhesion molecule 5-like n=1 Tax=Odobenus rosmarus divergens TaxID=9708 RepID=A0A9B0GXU5_ODORO
SLDNRTLTIYGVTRNDTGPYECETRNPVSAGRSDPFTLNVLYGPDAPTISPSESYYHPGANLSLSCHAASNPPAQYSWFISGRPQSSTQELFIPNITANDSGSYTCQAHQPDSGTTHSNVLSVVCTAELPKPSITSNNSNPVENVDSVVITCGPQTPSTSYLWSVNRMSLQASARLELSLDNRTLTIHSVTRNDTGPYECETRNPVSAGHSDPFTLNVLYGPDAPTISPSDSYYHLGAKLSLSCHAASNPPAEYSWFINGRPQSSTQELFIPNITPNDSGSYVCLAYNSGTRLNKTIVKTITVSAELPKPSITSNNSNPVENVDSVVIMCGPQTQSTGYLWSVNNESLPASATLELSLDNRTLTIHGVTRNDTGPYECETRNPVSAGRSDPFTLNVLYGPDSPIISPSDTYYHPGDNLSLSCHAASNPPAQYSWFISGRPQSSTQELFIPKITVNDSGSYTCLAYNSGTRLNKTTVKTITVSDDRMQPDSGLPPGAIAGIVTGVLAGVAVIAALVYFLFIRKTDGASDLRDVTEHKPSASNHSQDHSDNLSNKGEEVAYSSLNFSAQESTKSTSASPSPAATETVYTEVRKM